MSDDVMPDIIYATPRGSGTLSGVYVDIPLGSGAEGADRRDDG